MKVLLIIFSLINVFSFYEKQNDKIISNLTGKWDGKIRAINDDISQEKNFTIIFATVTNSTARGKIVYDNIVFLNGEDSFTGFFINPNELAFKIKYTDEETNGIFYFGGVHELKISNNTILGLVRNQKNEIIAKFKLIKNEN